LIQARKNEKNEEDKFNNSQSRYASKLWNAGYFNHRTNLKCYSIKALNKHKSIIDKTRNVGEFKLIQNYNEIVSYYKNKLPITMRILEDSKIVDAFIAYTSNPQ